MAEEMKRKLRRMLNDIREELEGAEHYQEIAIHISGSNDANAYKEMAQQEMNHAKALCEITNKWVQSMNDSVLHVVWEFEHECLMDWKNELSAKMASR